MTVLEVAIGPEYCIAVNNLIIVKYIVNRGFAS